MDNKTIGKGTFDITPREEFFEDTKEKRQSLPRQKRKYNRTFRITDEEGVVKTYSMDRKVSYADFIHWPKDIQIKYFHRIYTITDDNILAIAMKLQKKKDEKQALLD